MLSKKEKVETIRLGFAVLQNYIRPGGSLNLTDINVHAEDFVGDMLNALRGWDLKNTNRETSNFPCIDLFGEKAKVGVQVTSEQGSGKINDALSCLKAHKMSTKIKHFVHFSLIPTQAKYTIHTTPPKISFDWKKDILSFDTLLKEVQIAADSELTAICKLVTKSLPSIFAGEAQRLTALRQEIHACLTAFDRQVLHAPFHSEDPVEMYKAIREIRVRLQERGASRIPHDIVAERFKKAKAILSACEADVRKRYPYIHDAAKTGVAPQYPDKDYGNSIRLMMNIRPKLEPLVSDVDSVLKELDNKLKIH